MCHFWYILGCAGANQLLVQPHWKHDYGLTMCFSSGINLILLLTNELLNYFRVYNYKCSLDETLNAINKQGLLLLDRKEIVDTLRASSTHFPEGYVIRVTQMKRRSKLSNLLLLLKVQSFMLFAPPMKMIIYVFAAPNIFWLIRWYQTICVFVFVLMSIFISARKSYMLFNAIQIVCLSAAIIVLTYSPLNFITPALMYFAVLTVLYPVGDISLMDTSDFTLTEVNLAIGFAIEKLLISIFMFALYYDSRLIIAIRFDESFDAYGASFAVYSAAMMLLVYFVYVNTHGKSLYTIRKEQLGIQLIRRSEQQPITVLPPINYAYNSRTGTYDFPTDKQRDVLASNLGPQSGGVVASTSNTDSVPVFVGGMDNRYDADLRRMTPGYVLPRAIIGGTLFSAFSFNI